MKRKGLEMTVGIFVVAGLILIGGLIIYFANFKEHFQDTYEVHVKLPSANGLIKGALVYNAGAEVGWVKSPPRVVDEGRAVIIDVALREGVEIRRNAVWTVGSSGLLGDANLQVAPPPVDAPQEPFLEDGDWVEGTRTTGIADLASSAEPVLKDAQIITAQLKEIAAKINSQVLTDENAQKLNAALKELDAILKKLNASLDEKEIRELIAKANNVVGNADKLFGVAGKGEGALYEVLADKETGDNLAAFIANLRKHGVLFYSDTAGKDKEDRKGKKEVEVQGVQGRYREDKPTWQSR